MPTQQTIKKKGRFTIYSGTQLPNNNTKQNTKQTFKKKGRFMIYKGPKLPTNNAKHSNIITHKTQIKSLNNKKLIKQNAILRIQIAMLKRNMCQIKSAVNNVKVLCQ